MIEKNKLKDYYSKNQFQTYLRIIHKCDQFMQLNIYIISHPIIKLLTHQTLNSEIHPSLQINTHKYTALFLIYEISRKWIRINNIYIKQFKIIKEIALINNSQKYFFCTNINQNYEILPDIRMILHQVKIIDIENNLEIFKKKLHSNIKEVKKDNIKILLFDNVLSDNYIINVLHYLTQYEDIKIDNINIACIYCYHQTLNIIGHQYSKLKIYTTKIIK